MKYNIYCIACIIIGFCIGVLSSLFYLKQKENQKQKLEYYFQQEVHKIG